MSFVGYSPPGPRFSNTFTIDSHDFIRTIQQTGAPASTAWPAANLAIYVPFAIEHPITVYETWVETGTLTTSNATQIGVYDTSGNRLFATATTVATASDTVNSSGMTDFVIGAGTYYLAISCDGTRAFLATVLSAGLYQAWGALEQTGLTGATLPSTWTPAVYSRAFMPLFGLNLRADPL